MLSLDAIKNKSTILLLLLFFASYFLDMTCSPCSEYILMIEKPRQAVVKLESEIIMYSHELYLCAKYLDSVSSGGRSESH